MSHASDNILSTPYAVAALVVLTRRVPQEFSSKLRRKPMRPLAHRTSAGYGLFHLVIGALAFTVRAYDRMPLVTGSAVSCFPAGA